MDLSKKLRKVNIESWLFIILTLVIVAVTVYFVWHGQNEFNRHEVRQIRILIQSYGFWSPLVVVFLVFLSTAIPPLPLPVPLVELAAGVAFGFWEGFLVIWFSQVFSSLFAFYISRFFRKGIFARFLENKRWSWYQNYLDQKGFWAILITRSTMSAPFNIISFLAGLSTIGTWNFLLATALGTIPESVLYSFIGSRLRQLRVNFTLLTFLVIGTGIVGFLFTLLMMRFARTKTQPRLGK
jgi:uncharacterized membrane protein YdjX (TVP38/TMEM64 family)